MTPAQAARIKEQIETLDGSRGQSKLRAAVRIEDLAPLMQIKDRMQAAKAAGAAPTKAEYDALVVEVEFLRARLYEVMQVLQTRLLP